MNVRNTGVIGLGAMGYQMARHMVNKGFNVAGYDVSLDAMKRARTSGIAILGSPAEVGDHAEIVIVMVATDAQVEDVIIRSSLLDRLQKDAVICVSSSTSPQTARELEAFCARRGIGLLDTPVVLGQ